MGEKWKFPSLGSPHGGEKWKFPSLGSPHGGEKKFPSLGSPHGGEKWKFPSLGSPHGGLSLGSPHGGKPPLAPLTDRNKPAVWAATPREAGWIWLNPHSVKSHHKIPCKPIQSHSQCPWNAHEILGTDLNVSDVLGIHLRPGNHLQDAADGLDVAWEMVFLYGFNSDNHGISWAIKQFTLRCHQTWMFLKI